MLATLLSLILALQADPSILWTSEVKTSGSTNAIVLTGTLAEGVDHVSGTIDFMSCIGTNCLQPEEWEFEEQLEAASKGEEPQTPQQAYSQPSGAQAQAKAAAASVPEQAQSPSSIWALIIEAVLWGLLMLLTPCVFPMVPMTISFFIKQRGGRAKALIYGLFIVLLYTIPICLIIGLTWLLGGSGVTADIFNWLATHWLPNIVFFLVFMVFAASFFGAFELTLPSKWTNGADRNSERKGLAGIFFLALTLVLVSFSCTGPIVGTVLIKSTQGEFWTPMLTMLAFSVAFALPFTLLALFPSILKKLPKSGGWLNSVKVVLGFVELALGLKFLSVADQTYHWHLLGREVYLAIWIVIFSLLGLYLLGKLRFRHDDPKDYLSVKRLILSIVCFAFVVYMIPGMWGAPLKALSGYLPPLESQDFVMTQSQPAEEGTIPIAQGLRAYETLDEAVAEASKSGKRIFVDISGHGCVNCREMEARVWSDPAVLKKLREDFVIWVLYVDDKTPIPESEQITTPEGRRLKDKGRLNSHIALTRFGVNSQPNYFILDSTGSVLKGPRAYDLSIPAYLEFLD